MRALSPLLALLLAGAAAPAAACTVAWRPPPYAVALERQVTHRQEAERIVLVRLVEARVENRGSVLLYNTVMDLNGAGAGEWKLPRFSMCRPNPKVGELALIYYDRVDLTDPASGRVVGSDYREREVVRVADNVDPEIGPLLRQAAQRFRATNERNRQLAERFRETSQ
jgi:hypothetical protein